MAVPAVWLITLGLASGALAGLLAGLIGIGGGVVVVPVVFYGLTLTGVSADQAAHVAIATSLAAILPTAIVSFLGHWRAGNTDLRFLREWGPGIAVGVIAAQLTAPHLSGGLLTGVFALLSFTFAVRFGLPEYFRPVFAAPPDGAFRSAAATGIGFFSGLAGVGGGILTNIVMTVSGMPMHKSIGRAAAAGIVVSLPATVVAALGPGPQGPTYLGGINIAILACITPSQAAGAWLGVRAAQQLPANHLSRIMALSLFATGSTMLYSSFAGG